jgi:DNA-binding transcriptional LysR family regulator
MENEPMDRLGNIEAFVCAAEFESLTRAAEKLRLSPSALSRRIAQLEQQLGVRLLHRTTRSVSLSEEGRDYFDRARSALRDLQEAEAVAARTRQEPSGLLRVEAPSIMGRAVVVPALRRFTKRFGEVRVELALRDHASDPRGDGVDLAVRLGPLPDSSLLARSLGRTRMRLCGAPSYLRRKGTPRALHDLERHERLGLVHRGRVLPWRLRDGTGTRELAPSGRFVVDSGEALVDLAASGAGLAWLCDFMIAHAQREGQLVEVLPELACAEAPLHALSLPSRHLLPKVKLFGDALKAELRGITW